MFKKLFLMLLFVTTFFSATPLNANILAPTEENVAELYIATFERAADSAGLQYWLNTGLSIEEIAQSFFDQDETKEKYPEDFTNEAFINEVYSNLFNRTPDAIGFNYWLIELDSGRISRDVFIIAVINGARGTDAMILDNKTEVGLAFAHDGRSDYDESVEILEDVTEDHQTVVDTLCEYDLGPCPIKDPPTADAGPDQMAVNTGNVVTLDGSASRDSNSSTYPDTNARTYADADSDPLTYKWTITIKPAGSTASLSGETTVSPTFTPDKLGGYVIELVVNNGTVNSIPDSVTVTPNGSNVPIANAGSNQSDIPAGETVTLDGSKSTAPANSSLTYKWTINGSPEGSGASLSDDTAVRPTFIADKYGSYQISLVVNDGSTDSVPSSVSVGTVVNTTPVANAGPDQDGVPYDVLVTLDGSASQDPGGDSLTYKWTMTAKPAESAASLSIDTIANPAFTPDEYGSYTIELVVNDGTDSSNVDSVTVATIEDPRIVWPDDGNGKDYEVVVSPDTNRSWLDRNMGADQPCTSSDDAGCYGDYYQWGRATDGHEISDSEATASLATDIDNAGSLFINAAQDPYDWADNDDGAARSVNWSKLDGSSVCPTDFRIPTEAELTAETTGATTVKVTDTDSAFASFLKIPAAGFRDGRNAEMSPGKLINLWTSSSAGTRASILTVGSNATWETGIRANGSSVRCIKDQY